MLLLLLLFVLLFTIASVVAILSISASQANSSATTNGTTTTTTGTNTTTNTPNTEPNRCIILIGGSADFNSPIEFYHPEEGVECSGIGTIDKAEYLRKTGDTAACYLAQTNVIAIRENFEIQPTLHDLSDASTMKLPYPYKSFGTPSATWGSTAASMNSARCISCGGLADGFIRLTECYEIASTFHQWTPIPPLPQSVNSAASVALDTNNYYVVGGSTGIGQSKQMYRYTVNEQLWYAQPTMPDGRYYHAASALSPTELIVCGGVSARSDCQTFTTTDKHWGNVASLNVGRQEFGLVPFNGRVYALGGKHNGSRLSAVESYDGPTDKWTVGKALKSGRSGFVVVVV